MTISNFDKNASGNSVKLIVTAIAVVTVLIWLCFPPVNKFMQICSWVNKLCLIASKTYQPESECQYIRNDAVFHVKMFPKEKKEGLAIIDNAIQNASKNSPSAISQLYKDKAVIQMFYGDYTEALNNYITAKDIQFNDYYNVALLYNELGKPDEAAAYCNEIINHEEGSYSGYSCLTHVYESINQPENALKIWDVAIDRKKTNPNMYVERGNLRKQLGDIDSANSDFDKAKALNSRVKLNRSLAQETLHPKSVNLQVMFFK